MLHLQSLKQQYNSNLSELPVLHVRQNNNQFPQEQKGYKRKKKKTLNHRYDLQRQYYLLPFLGIKV